VLPHGVGIKAFIVESIGDIVGKVVNESDVRPLAKDGAAFSGKANGEAGFNDVFGDVDSSALNYMLARGVDGHLATLGLVEPTGGASADVIASLADSMGEASGDEVAQRGVADAGIHESGREACK
jgi:hypothetical protein